MIVYDLNCQSGHQFEGWFNKAGDYQAQLDGGLLACPVCGSTDVRKLPTASHVATHHGREDKDGAAGNNAVPAAIGLEALRAIHRYVDEHFDDVGDRFPEEARKIHYGEADARNIRGLATPAEARELREEGVQVHSLPPKPLDKEKLN